MKRSLCSIFIILVSVVVFSGCDLGNGGWAGTGFNLSRHPITSLAYDGTHNLLYAGTSEGRGGAWRYDGTKWVSIGKGISGYGIRSLAYDSKHNILYAGCWNDSTYAGGVFAYDGHAWSNTGGDISNNIFQSLACDEKHGLLYAGCASWAKTGKYETGSGLWKYDGTTWTYINSDATKGGAICLTYDPVHDFLYVYGHWRYDGTSWVYTGGSSPGSAEFSVYDSKHDILYDAQGGIGVEKYDGKSWTQIGKDVSRFVFNSIACDPAHNLLYVGASPSGRLLKYDGKKWTNMGGEVSNYPAESLAFDPVHNLLYGGSSNGVWSHVSR